MARFSHSALNKYLSCPKAFDYHYNKKYRSAEQSAALLFGTAIDKATENYAQNRNKELAISTFEKNWKEQELNGTITDLRSCTEIVYGNNDLDLELINESDYVISDEAGGYESILNEISKVLERKTSVGFKYLKRIEKEILNNVNWICMSKKGILMLDTFIDWFDNNVTEVLKTQGKIELDNGDDTVIGYYDLMVRLKCRDKPVLLDIKTAGRAYDHDAVIKSPQLALYLFATKHLYEDTNTAGYVVLHKTMKKNRTKICLVCGFDGSGATHKKCNNELEVPNKSGVGVKLQRCNGEWDQTLNVSATIQVLVNEVPELLQERVAENYDMMSKAVKAEIYPRNYGSCVTYGGAVICPFTEICHKNCMKNIIIKED